MASENELIASDIEGYLARYQNKELCRFVAVGSVDDGKSTLIGRMLYDTGMVYEDQLAAVRRASNMEGTDIDLSLLTDGLTAEREQGITIDVAYRYFTTDKRKFIIADTPGHIQYTRNMVTGASTADVAIILIDARLGVLQQSRRHAYIASLLGIPHLAVCVNKMDLVAYDKDTFTRICDELRAFTKDLRFAGVHFFPISALKGVNCVNRGAETPWYSGQTVLEFLETVPLTDDNNFEDFRFPVQYVVRPNLDYRGFASQIASGVVKKGDPIMVLPSGKTSTVRSIDTFDGELEEAFTPQSVVIRLADEIDCSRGDMLVHPHNTPSVARTFDATVVWMHETELDPGKSYWIKHTTQLVRATVDVVHHKTDMDTLHSVPVSTLGLNDIGRVTITCVRPIYFDGYDKNRGTGCFIIVDSITNNTVGAGMIEAKGGGSLDEALRAIRVEDDASAKSQISERERVEKLGSKGAIVVVSGRAGSGVNALAYAIERRLFDASVVATVLPSAEASAAHAVAKAGLVGVVAIEGAFDVAALVASLGGAPSVLVAVTTPEDICKTRRPGADMATASLAKADVTVDLTEPSLERAAQDVLAALVGRGVIKA